MSEELQYRYEVAVQSTKEKQAIPKAVRDELKASGLIDDKGKIKLKGISAKMFKRMRQEYVECPVLEERTHFIKCFICSNFQSRVNGKVLCKGEGLEVDP